MERGELVQIKDENDNPFESFFKQATQIGKQIKDDTFNPNDNDNENNDENDDENADHFYHEKEKIPLQCTYFLFFFFFLIFLFLFVCCFYNRNNL